MKVTGVEMSRNALANFQGRFFLLVDQSGDGCWMWKGPRHSSGAGRYLWKKKDGGNDRYVLCNRVAYFLATGELPAYLRNLCGNLLCCKASHWWKKPSGRWKPKPRKAIRGRVRQLADSEIQRIRLLATLSHDEDQIGIEFGLSKRQVADIALGKVRREAGGRIRSSRHLGIRHYHNLHEQEVLSLRANEPVVPRSPVALEPQVAPIPNHGATGPQVSPGISFPSISFDHGRGQRLPRTTR